MIFFKGIVIIFNRSLLTINWKIEKNQQKKILSGKSKWVSLYHQAIYGLIYEDKRLIKTVHNCQ